MILLKKDHVRDLIGPGTYCIATCNGERHVVMRCPACSQIMFCLHKVITEDPLTLQPSVVGPQNLAAGEVCCGHHFFVTNGYVENLT